MCNEAWNDYWTCSTTNFSEEAGKFLAKLRDLEIFTLLMAADGIASDSWPFGSGVPFIGFKNRRMDIT